MFNQIFSSYLCESGLITKAQAETALKTAQSTRARIGTMVIESGLMTAAQAERVNALQASTNARFGDIAIEQGFITADQFDEVFMKQSKTYVAFKQALCDENVLSSEKFNEALAQFKQSLGLSDEVFELLQNNDVPAFIKYIARVAESDVAECKYAEILISLVVRLITGGVHVKACIKTNKIAYKHIATQRAHGEGEYIIAIATDDTDAAVHLAQTYYKQPTDGLDEDAEDSIKEFLNCAGGILISELGNNNILDLYIDPPEYHLDAEFTKNALVVPFSLPTGDFALIILT